MRSSSGTVTANNSSGGGGSAFAGGFRAAVDALVEETAELYRSDGIPWVLGYSGGKDSTAALTIVWLALQSLAPDERTKPVHVISTDTLVENPVVASWVSHSLEVMGEQASQDEVPIEPHRLTPELKDTFWVNLLGRGYPAPRPLFRWCTERLKILPANEFIRSVVRANGEAIVVLGTRKAESSRRSHIMTELEQQRVRARLSPNASLPNSLVFSPIENWSNDDVWLFLMQVDSPWGGNNKDLLAMYRGASEDNECPLVVDTSTPSCGDSRFGCWVCTLVDKDRSMSAMIQNDVEKTWMLPLMELRDELDIADDRHLRDFRRMSGRVQLFGERDEPIPGPYTSDARHHLLRSLLEAQTWIQRNGPPAMRGLSLISDDELNEIRRMWVVEKYEIEDELPVIYEEVTGDPFPGPDYQDRLPLDRESLALLREASDGDELHYELLRGLIGVEDEYRSMVRRAGLFDALESVIQKSYYEGPEDATEWARGRRELRDIDGLIAELEPVAGMTDSSQSGAVE